MILIEPIGGLANRMRVIASGIWLKEKLNTDLIVIWNENYELNCPFNLLFEQIEGCRIKKKRKIYQYLRSSNQASLRKRIASQFINKLAGIDLFIQEADFPDFIWNNKIDILTIAKGKKSVYIQTCQEFGENIGAFRLLKPVLCLQNKIRKITSEFNDKTIGIHIRRSDNAISIELSPLVLFVEAIQSEIALGQPNFFLCTDNCEVKEFLVNEYSEKILTLNIENNRTTISGMQDAVVDLYCLASTHKIYGSYYSSYTDIAARINDSELIIIKK